MPSAKKILITTESYEIFKLNLYDRKKAFGFCSECGDEVEILTLDQAVSLSGIGTRKLIRLTEGDQLHALETESGHLLICLTSITTLKSQPKMEKKK